MNLGQYNQLEQLSNIELSYLETSILDVFKGVYTVDSIYIVGSFCFGLDKANDIDIVVCVPENESYIRYDQPTGDNVYYMFEGVLSGLITRKVGKQVSLLPHNYNDFLTNCLQDIKPPMYNLIGRQWVNKQPGDRWNNWILRQGNKSWIVDRDSDEGRQLAIDNNKI